MPQHYFLEGAECGGCATVRRAGGGFNPDGRALLPELERRHLLHHFDFDGSFPYTEMLRNQISGKNNSWAVRWQASCYLADKLTLYPGRSLVENIGNDYSGPHSLTTSVYSGAIASQPIPFGTLDQDAYEADRKDIIRVRWKHVG